MAESDANERPHVTAARARLRVPPAMLDDWLTTAIPSPDARAVLVAWASQARDLRDPVVLVGAGMTMGATVPAGARLGAGTPGGGWSWARLAREMAEVLPAGEREGVDPLWLAQLYREQLGSAALHNLVQRAAGEGRLTPSDAHRALVGIPWGSILTTNYDDLLEQALRTAHVRPHTVWKDDQLPMAEPRSTVLHLHGVLDDPASIVLTLDAYRRYPKDHPGLLTKVRQLLMEHPTLLLGFSATDPNFVQWMGWLDDVLGEQHPLIVSLHITVDGASVSAARDSYWNDRVRFVPCKAEDVPGVLEHLRDFLHGLMPAAVGKLPTRFGDHLEATKDAKDGRARMLRIFEADPETRHDDTRRQALIDRLVGRLAVLRYGRAEVEAFEKPPRASMDWLQHWARLGRTDEAEAAQQRVTTQRTFLRSACLPIWRDILGWAPLRLHNKSFTICGVEFDYAEEARRLADLSDDHEPVLRNDAWLDLLRVVHTSALWPTEDVEAWDREHKLTEDERATLDDIKAQSDLFSGASPSPPPTALRAQDKRRIGFLAAMAGEHEGALSAYVEAVHLSEAEQEPADVRWASWESVRYAADARSRDDDPASADGARWREEAEQRSFALFAESGATIWPRLSRRLYNGSTLVSESWKQRATPPSRSPGAVAWRNIAGASGLDWMDEHWLHPRLSDDALMVAADRFWRLAEMPATITRENAWHHAVALWRRTGTSALHDAVRHLIQFGDPDHREPVEILDALLVPGRWLREWEGAAKAIGEALPTLRPSHLEQLDGWISAAEGAHDGQPRATRPRAGEGPWLATLLLRVQRLTLASPPDALAELGQLVGSFHLGFPFESLNAITSYVVASAHRQHVNADHAAAVLTDLIKQEARARSWVRLHSVAALLSLPNTQQAAVRPTLESLIARDPSRVVLQDMIFAAWPDDTGRAAARTLVNDVLQDFPAAIAADLLRITRLATLVEEDHARALVRAIRQRLDDSSCQPAARLPTFGMKVDPASRPADPGELAALAALLCHTHPVLEEDAATSAVRLRWQTQLRESPQETTGRANARSTPASWMDEIGTGPAFDHLLRGRRETDRPTADADRHVALGALDSWAWISHPFAWSRLPALSTLLRHRDAALCADAVRVVGRLAANPDAVIPEGCRWDRWCEILDHAADDRRVLVRMAVAWTVARAAKNKEKLPTDVNALIARLRNDLVGDDRVGVQHALNGW